MPSAQADLTLQELAALVGGQFASGADLGTKITGAAAISDAAAGDVTFLANARYLPALKASKATAALVPESFRDSIPAIAVRVENPAVAFAKILERLAPEPVRFPPGVHPSAVLGSDVELGEGASIQAFVVIEAGAKIGARTLIGAGSYIGHEARIGADCQLAPRVTVGARCLIGDRVILHSGAVIGSDGFGFELVDGRHLKIPQTGIVQIDDDVEIGANTTIDRARFGRTWIGEGTKIDNLVQIAHNVVIGKHCILCAQGGISGSTQLGNYVVLGGQVGMVGHIQLGDRVQVGAQSGITKSVPAGATIWGTPHQPMKEHLQQLAWVRRLGKLADRVRRLEQVLGEPPKTSPPGT